MSLLNFDPARRAGRGRGARPGPVGRRHRCGGADAPGRADRGADRGAQVARPATVTAVNDFRILFNVYDGLVRYASGTLEVEPALAESWEISEDGTVYTFTLREGVTFHDGSPLNAEAVKFNFDRVLNEDHPYYDTGPFPLSFFFSAIETIETPDDMTVEITLSEPYAPFLSNLAYSPGLIVSQAAVEEHGAEFGRNPSGTGAFKLRRMAVERGGRGGGQPDYWDGAPALEAVVFRPITDANTRTAEMLAGGIDLMVEVPPVSLSEFQGDEYTVHEQAGPHVWFLILNTKGGAVRRQARAAGRELRHQQGVDRRRRAGRHRRGRRRSRRRPPSPGPTTRTWSPIPTIPTRRASCWRRPGRGGGADLLRHRRRLGDARSRWRWAPRSRPIWRRWASTSRSRPTSGTPSSAR
jgi:hypothetical protein